MNGPLVSVIIPTHNRSSMLQRAVKSAVRQTYRNIEIIIIDDGSTDDTKAIVKNFKDERISYYQKENSGPSDSRNLGINKSIGKYIAFLDDDDTYNKNKIGLQVNYMEINRGVAFCYTNASIGIGKIKHTYINRVPENDYQSLIINKNYIVCPSVMIRKSKLDMDNLFQKEYEPVEDYELLTRLAKNNPFGFMNKILYYYNVHNTGISKNIHKLIYNNSRIRYTHLHNLSGSKTKKNNKSILIQLLYHAIIKNYYESDFKTCRKAFMRLLKLNPFQINIYIFFFQTYIPKNLLLNPLYKIYFKFKKEKAYTV